MSNTPPMLAGALDDGRKAVKWATDYFLKAHTAPNEFYGQVGEGDLDHVFWGRPEDMTMPRPSYKIDTSRPGKLASCSILLTSMSQLSSGELTACSKRFVILSSETFISRHFTDAVIPGTVFLMSLFQGTAFNKVL